MPGVQALAFGCQTLVDRVRQSQIHVVAAQQDVITDRHAGQLEFALFFVDGNEREVGGSAADIDDQDDFAGPNLFAKLITHRLTPRIESGLGFLNQCDLRASSAVGGLEGQIARGGVK